MVLQAKKYFDQGDSQAALNGRNTMEVYTADDGRGVVINTSCKTASLTSSLAFFDCNPPGQKGRSLAALLEAFDDFSPRVRDFVDKTVERDISVFSLVGGNIPKYTYGSVVLVGDAAHCFPPYCIEKVAIAIEDSASLGVSHHSTQIMRQHKWSKVPRLSWRQPVGFGPMTSPRQHITRDTFLNPRPERLVDATSFIASTRFRTSATLSRNIISSETYSFFNQDTVAEASFVVQAIDNLSWLSGGGYNLLLFQIHGIQHKSESQGLARQGSYVALVLEDHTDPIISEREDLGWPKLYSDITFQNDMVSGGGFSVTLLEGDNLGVVFMENLQPHHQAIEPPQLTKDHVFVHKYIPATTESPSRETADAYYDVMMPPQPPSIRAGQVGSSRRKSKI
ncbi:Fc.00g000160.m01.CDS01 [Cosmosporella sp. VM-42]